MTDLSVLIPPILMAAAVVVGIAMFLRHEMGRARPDQQAGDACDRDNSAAAETGAGKIDGHVGDDEDASATARRDG